MNKLTILGAVATVAVAAAPAPADAQREGLDLAPTAAFGQTVSPFFEGWVANPDGTYTLSFGYFNRNSEEVVEIPLGPDNFIEPAEYDGMQPTSFAPVNYGGYNGRRERGVFAITVPGDFGDGEVVWTLRMNGEILQVPGRTASTAYELSADPMAMGSAPPTIWFRPGGATGYGPRGVVADETVKARAGVPVEVAFFAADDRSDREEGGVPLGVTWWKHQGPGTVTFGQRANSIPHGSAGPISTTATFSEPGSYMLRIRVDNHRAPDSAPADECCWSNGYLRVEVAE